MATGRDRWVPLRANWRGSGGGTGNPAGEISGTAAAGMPFIRAVVHGAFVQAAPLSAGQRVRIWGGNLSSSDPGSRRSCRPKWQPVESAAFEIAVAGSASGIAASDEYWKGMLRGYEGIKGKPGQVVTVRFTGRGSGDPPVAIAIGGTRAEIVQIPRRTMLPVL